MNHLFSQEGSGEAVKQKLFQKFKEYLASAQKEMQVLYDLQNEKNDARLKVEADKIQMVIDEKQKVIDVLKERIQEMKDHKKLRTFRLYSTLTRANNKKTKKVSLSAWIKYHQNRIQKRKMNIYIESFCRRGSAMRHFKAWKQETMQFHKNNVNVATQKKIHAEVNLASQRATEEVGILRLMVKELTEDLRSETIAKNTLKYKFEQALLRGMSALNMENMNIQQDIISQNRSFTETSRALLFTPEKFGYFTRS
jgi:hypothetical protein